MSQYPVAASAGYYSLDGVYVTQTITDLNVIGTSVRIRFIGNGRTSYRISYPTITYSSVTKELTVNGQNKLITIPAFGRWSDFIDMGVSVSGSVIVKAFCWYDTPLVVPIINMNDQWPSGTPEPGIVGGIGGTDTTGSIDTADNVNVFSITVTDNSLITAGDKIIKKGLSNVPQNTLLLCNFESGLDDEVNGISPTGEGYTYDDSFCKFGSGSLKFAAEGSLSYGDIAITNKTFTFQFWVYSNEAVMEGLIPAKTWTHFAVYADGTTMYYAVGGTVIMSGPVGSLTTFPASFSALCSSGTWFDAIEVRNDCLWGSSNFSPPVVAPTYVSNVIWTKEYVFANIPSGADNEIIIGPSAATTAQNIITTINNTPGALDTAKLHEVIIPDPNKFCAFNFNESDNWYYTVEEATNARKFIAGYAKLDSGTLFLNPDNLTGSNPPYNGFATISFSADALTGDFTAHGLFTIEGVNTNAISQLILIETNSSNPLEYIKLEARSIDGTLFLWAKSNNDFISETVGTFTIGVQYHFAITAQGNDLYFFIDGHLIKKWQAWSEYAHPFTTCNVFLSRTGSNALFLDNYQNSYRIGYFEIARSVLWTDDFTPPSSVSATYTIGYDDDVIDVIEYEECNISVSVPSGLTVSPVKRAVYYSCAGAFTIPAFTGNGFCTDGTVLPSAFLPALTSAGTCTQDDFCIGRGVLPAATCNAQSFITGVSYSSTDAEKISLLLYGNGWMQNFAGMVGIASEPDASALLAVQFVANYITYAPDLTTWSVADYWIDPRATLYYATGDCEDGAFLLASILLNLGVSHTKVRVAIGTYNGVGHAWVLYQRDSDGLWVLLDWTAGATYWNAISDIDDLSIAYSTSGYNPTEYVTAYYVSDVASVTSSVFMYDNALTAWLQVVTEALEFADSVTRGLGIGIHDWLTLKDTQANNWNGKETVPDALMLYDLATGYQRYSVSVVDSLDVADAATRALLIAVLEKLHFTDLAGMIATISKTATDSLDLTDFAGNTYLDTITEALSLVDVASILKTTYGVVSEALAFADTLSGYRNLPLSATSTLTLSETVSAKGTFYRAVYDTIIMNVMVELAGEVYECYVLNTPKFLPSMYSGFNFNSYCVFENRAFAANGTGIYELTGDTDAGTAIHSGVLMHNSDFGAPHQKRFRRGYLGISGGSPVMVLETEDGGRLAYTIDNNGKAVFSHEQKSKKWTLSVSDFDELDSIKLIPVILSR